MITYKKYTVFVDHMYSIIDSSKTQSTIIHNSTNHLLISSVLFHSSSS